MDPDALSKDAGRIAGMFDSIAGRYDLLNHLLSAGIDRRWRKLAVRSLQLDGRDIVLDLCTGTGDLAIAALTQTTGARRVVGVDFAGEMLRVGLAKIRRMRVDDRITLARGDATRLPLANASVDATTIAFGIRNVDDTRAACAEIHRVLKPGGRLAILEFAIPTGRLIRPLYLWYFRRVLPMIGRVVSRHNAAYGYLPASVAAFATPDEFVTILRQSGFQSISAVPLTFGIVFLYTARARATTDTAIPRRD
ncbi:MAG TPA: bifunctional demethylmenaquinone methyltransferase/2-methoxy-6-polyprenyl-1,4-benzoquinol methylase UbiE [Vicinamibacterales bacterium]